MRINAGSKLTAQDVYEAARIARLDHGHDIHIEELAVSPRGAITFYGESYGGKRRVNRGSDAYAATWTAWGYLIAELYRRDPNAKIGHYKNATHFRKWCSETRDNWVRHQSHLPDRPGADVSFLELLKEVTA